MINAGLFLTWLWSSLLMSMSGWMLEAPVDSLSDEDFDLDLADSDDLTCNFS